MLRVKVEGLDDYERLFIDSTGVWANTSWPTDSKMFWALLRSVYEAGQKLEIFECKNFTKFHCVRWLNEIKELDFKRAHLCGKPGSKRKRNHYYRRLLNRVDKMRVHLVNEHQRFDKPTGKLLPSYERQLDELLDLIASRLDDVKLQRQQTYQRIAHDEVAPASERKMSLNDPDCSYIAKGSREAIIGYKPSLGRSGKGFVVRLVLPNYNAADSEQLVPVTEQAIERTQVTPNCVSVDDGYSSKKGRKTLKDKAIEVVSINGSKGKKITPEEEWESQEYHQARLDRSSVESLMFTLKFNYDFGRLGRLGHAAAKSEMLEKILAHNQVRIVERILQIEEDRQQSSSNAA